MRTRSVDVMGIFAVAPRADRPQYFRRDQLREAQNRIERRSQLVTHIGEERRFRSVRGLRFEAFAQRVVARVAQFHRQVVVGEAVRKHHFGRRRPATTKDVDMPKLSGGDQRQRQRNRVAAETMRAMVRSTSGRHAGKDKRRHACARQRIGPDDDRTPHHDKDIVEGLPGVPQHPGEQSPDRAGRNLKRAPDGAASATEFAGSTPIASCIQLAAQS